MPSDYDLNRTRARRTIACLFVLGVAIWVVVALQLAHVLNVGAKP